MVEFSPRRAKQLLFNPLTAYHKYGAVGNGDAERVKGVVGFDVRYAQTIAFIQQIKQVVFQVVQLHCSRLLIE